MAAIGLVSGTNEKGFVGQLATISIRVPIEIRPNPSKSGEVQLRAENAHVVSHDTITFESDGAGGTCGVTRRSTGRRAAPADRQGRSSLAEQVH